MDVAVDPRMTVSEAERARTVQSHNPFNASQAIAEFRGCKSRRAPGMSKLCVTRLRKRARIERSAIESSSPVG